ncbi:MAG: NrfD/PsrC family molybdoenzyme membrane anchor subunit [Candidatus Methylomirabilales bacterium]
MEPIVLWQQKWGTSLHIPWYLFLGGLAGGTMTLAALADLLGGRSERLRYFARVAAFVTTPAIVIGGLFLTLHMGKPERGFAFPLFFTNYQSWMTIGGWIVGAFAPLSVAYAAAWYFRLDRRTRLALALPGIPLGILMSLYTGFLLSAAWVIPASRWYVPLWDKAYLPVLFLLSGFSTALGAAGLAVLLVSRMPWLTGGKVFADEAGAVAKVASRADLVAVLAEGAWVYVFLASLSAGTVGQQLAYKLVTRGELAPWFWWGFVATGLAAPLVVGVLHVIGERLVRARMDWMLYAEFALLLVGGLMLRHVIVWGGDLKAPLIFPPSMWPVPAAMGVPIPGVGG